MGLGIKICLLVISIQFLVAMAQTNSLDVAALKALASGWTNTPQNWSGYDPCGSKWEGIECKNSRITSIILGNTGLTGMLSADIGSLVALQTLDLSYNKGLIGSLNPAIGSLTNLTDLVLVGCGFSGLIPDQIGSLQKLVNLSLTSNSFSGSIPPSIGLLSNLYWLDISDNKLSGTIPVSSGSTTGLDMLINTQHFHFGTNELSGEIPSRLFSSSMNLIHLLFENNRFSGSIPPTLALVKKLSVVRLDSNLLTGSVPSQISNLTSLNLLYLSNNHLSGPIPNLSTMTVLQYVDLSNNTFDSSAFPSWFLNLPVLTTIVMENTSLSGTLDINSSSNQLQRVDLQDNSITGFKQEVNFAYELILVSNPVCEGTALSSKYCVNQQPSPSYSTPYNNSCTPPTCSSNQVPSPNCGCGYPYTGTLFFRAPSFSDIGDKTIYTTLESLLMGCFLFFHLPVDSISLSSPFKNAVNYLVIRLKVFPSGQDSFNQTAISEISWIFSSQIFSPSSSYGPYYFLADAYTDSAAKNKSSKTGIIVGVAAAGSVLLLLALLAGFYAIHQKRRAEKADRVNNPFASWDPNTTSGAVPMLKGARCFSFDELKKYTKSFAEANSIGAGGYGKVYRGTLPDGQLVAIKRAQQGSMQGGLEFKTEIELLSRVHHKNVVGLIGFCFDEGEQMLVYEYIANGTLNESLSGKTGIRLSWGKRLRVALGAAKGLQYLHELANPPIIHRDIKSNNILLDESLNAKVADFGLSKTGDTDKTHVSTQVKGTMGYMDPEYYMTQQLSEKSDVYSFGVVLLEIVTARQPIEKSKHIVREVRERMKRDQVLYGLDDILDPIILTPMPDGLEKFVDLALRCVEEDGVRRPAMGAVVKEIENVMQIAGLNPTVESASSSATYEGDSHNHPYTDDSLFNYSGAFPISSKSSS